MANFKERKIAYDAMQGVVFLEPDLELLKKKKPDHPLVTKPIFKKEQHQKEILWELLDFVTKVEITVHRREFFKKEEADALKACHAMVEDLAKCKDKTAADVLVGAITDKVEILSPESTNEILEAMQKAYPKFPDPLTPSEIAAEAGRLTAVLKRAETEEEAEKIKGQLIAIIDQAPEVARATMLNFSLSVAPEFKDGTKVPTATASATATDITEFQQKLKEFDLEVEKPDYPTMVALAKGLGIKPEVRNKEGMKAALVAYKTKMQMANPETDETSQELLDQLQEALDENEELEETNQELTDKNEELESENQELQNENEALKKN